MQRRSLLKLIAAATGTALVGSFASAYEIQPDVKLENTGFSKDDVALLNEIGEVIIPRTETPGAKDANVGAIMAVIVSDCYTQSQRKIFKNGFEQLKNRSQAEYSKPFLLLSDEQKMALFTALDKEAKEHNAEREPSKEERLPHYFTLYKQLTLFTFFSSEKGATQVLRHVAIPGSYDGEYPYKKGDKAWYR